MNTRMSTDRESYVRTINQSREVGIPATMRVDPEFLRSQHNASCACLIYLLALVGAHFWRGDDCGCKGRVVVVVATVTGEEVPGGITATRLAGPMQECIRLRTNGFRP